MRLPRHLHHERADLGSLRTGPARRRTGPAVFSEGWKQEVEQPLFDTVGRDFPTFILPLPSDHVDRDIHQVAHHGLYIAPHVPDLGELRGLHFDERRARQTGQPPGDLGLPYTGRPDHDDIVGENLVPEGRVDVLPPPPVSQRDGHGFLRLVLPHDVLVQLFHYLARGERSEVQ